MKIFYSWQSDLPNGINRGFIETAIEKAIKVIVSDGSIAIVPVIDSDTAGVAGSRDIGQTILKKIEECEVFVADVTIINSNDTGRKTPNPNVLFELGYALRSIGESRIILVQNTEYGPPELLPFDLRMKKVITYSMNPESEEKAPERNILYKKLESELRVMIPEVLESQKGVKVPPVDEVVNVIHLPKQRIRLHQIYSDITSEVCSKFETVDEDELKHQFSREILLERVRAYEERVLPLEELFAVAGQWGEQIHEKIWAECLTRIANPKEPMQWVDRWLKLRRYPALRLLYSGGAIRGCSR